MIPVVEPGLGARRQTARLVRRAAAVALCGWLASCSHDDSIKLAPPFNDNTVVGDVSAVWSSTGEERGFAGGDRLKEPEVRFRYRLDVRNKLGDKLFVRLGGFELVGESGLSLASDQASVECALGAGPTPALLQGDVWIPKHAAGTVTAFRVSHLAIPLSDRGRALYREWLLQGRSSAAAEIDAEIARYAAAPACVSH